MEIIGEYIPNYHINIVNPNKIKDLSVFDKDLQMIFGMVQLKQCKNDMITFVTENKDYFENVDIEIVYGVEAMVGSDFLSKNSKNRTITGGVNVCKAFNDMIEEGRELGIEEGRELGIEEERLAGIYKLITALQELGTTDDVIISALVKQYGLTEEKAVEYLCVNV